MLTIVRTLTWLIEFTVSTPVRVFRFLLTTIAFNPRLGALRWVVGAGVGYLAFALILVYVVAPVRGLVGGYFMADKLRYDAERWLATAVYDARGDFVGTFDPRLDSRRDVNYTDQPIEMGDYTAQPDHKSIPVRDVPPAYWNCLLYHEDRYLGGPLNPYGIDLAGVLKIPYSTLVRSIARHRLSLGVGGSTLPMQFARVIYNSPPSASESSIEKLSRKLKEWWLAPVIFDVLTKGGDYTPLKQWAANHIWLAQRTGGAPLLGVEVTSRIVFGKDAKDLSVAEQFVLASAVNKPIILMEGSDRLNEVRLDRWRYITEVRARTCAEKLLTDPEQQKQVLFELVQLAAGPPDPKVRPRLQAALEQFAPAVAKSAQASPVVRANALLPVQRYGIRQEMKEAYGFGWREKVRGVTTTFDVAENLAFRERVKAVLAKMNAQLANKIDPGFTLDPDKISEGQKMPHVAVVAANVKGEIVRYFETGEQALYFGSIAARDRTDGHYDPAKESRAIASTGKMLVGIGLANEGKDEPSSLYLDTSAPTSGLETCAENGNGRAGRKAIVAFACSLNNPVGHRAALLGQDRIRALIDAFGFAMPPADAQGSGVPPSTAATLGLIAGAPRRVHLMSAVILNALLDRGNTPVKPPRLIQAYDFTSKDAAATITPDTQTAIIPRKIIRREGQWLLRTLLEAPYCYQAGGVSQGTLKSLANWCAARRPDLRLNFAKTGTMVTTDPNATVDTWATGGIQFANGAAYSYVVVVGTGSVSEPWGRSIHAAQASAPLLEALLQDLSEHARQNPQPQLLPAKPPAPIASAAPAPALPVKAPKLQVNADERARIFNRN